MRIGREAALMQVGLGGQARPTRLCVNTQVEPEVWCWCGAATNAAATAGAGRLLVIAQHSAREHPSPWPPRSTITTSSCSSSSRYAAPQPRRHWALLPVSACTTPLTKALLHPGNGPGRFVPCPALCRPRLRAPSPQAQLTRRPAVRRPLLVCARPLRLQCLQPDMTHSSASPFWRTTSSSTTTSPPSKKVIGASYSHADMLNFSSLYARAMSVPNRVG